MSSLPAPFDSADSTALSLTTTTTWNDAGSTSLGALSHTTRDTEDELWCATVQRVSDKLAPKDAAWLMDKNNRTPLTSTKLVEVIQSQEGKYSQHPVQTLFARIEPIVSHIRSFAQVITVFTQTDPTGTAGLIWGSLYMVLRLACRNQQALEMIIYVLSDISMQLGLFAKWQRMFPQKSFSEVGEAIKIAYEQMVGFCIHATRYLRRNPFSNFVRVLVQPALEQELAKYDKNIRRCMVRVRNEVDTAHMQFVQGQLAAISSLIDASPTPRYLELPAIRIIPHSRNHRFFGRHKILEGMRRLLLPFSGNKQQRFALSGPGGSGKTQIALEYTYKQLEDYKAVIWILADSPEKISQGFAEAAELLGIPKGSQSSSQVKAFVLSRLCSTEENFLLCFDNVDDLDLIKDCFPRTNNGCIILTTRDNVSAEDICTNGTMVPEFSRAEGRDFLRSLLPAGVCATFESEHILEDISDVFHGYPLALAQIAGFIKSGGCSLEDFLAKFRDTITSGTIAAFPVADYKASTVWTMSFNTLSARSRQILEILVYLDPDSVPFQILREGCIPTVEIQLDTDLGFMSDPLQLMEAIRGLGAQSLVRTNPDLQTISIHRFFQDQAFHHLSKTPTRRRKAFEEALFLLANKQPIFPSVTKHWSPDLFRASEQCLPHIMKLASRFIEFPDIFKGLENGLGKVVSECAVYQFQLFHHHAATQTFALARKIVLLGDSPDPLILSDGYRMEGRMFNESGQAIQGVESGKQARHYADLAITEGLIKEEDQRLPRILTGLGNSLSQLERFDEALAAQLEAKNLIGDASVEESDAITIMQLNLGFLMYRSGDLDGAEAILRATLEASPRTAPAMYALGNTLLAKGEIEEALAIHVRGLEIYIDMFGDQHALVSRTAYKIGEILLLHKGDTKTARTYIQKAIGIYLKQESPYYTVKAHARAERMLGKAFEREGRDDVAKMHYEQAWLLRERIDGVRGSANDGDEVYRKWMFYWDQ
ncbi:hypothetical protein CC80DRAFT_588059 [Byssothecium circinans]|uniref:Uncharacterized protein n=1 Tax=Byssothecium circinans TaxID=147558 RepID=A0A6A5UFM0_9PLEO|nr:hypothetical protein CC80DRAFT_588059 [Byssothecium circinans]